MDSEKKTQFHEMGLDDRILKAIARLRWSEPTPIQEKAIPLALDGKDILSRACTGSGKTATYSIPIIQQLLRKKKTSIETLTQEVRALVMVPSRELSHQANKMMKQLTLYCSKDIKSVDLCVEPDPQLIRPLLALKPDIVIGTPSRILANIRAGNLSLLNSLEWLVMDEADLLFSFGYEADFKNLLPHFPNSYQAFLMSATFSDDIVALKKLVLRNPVTLNLEDGDLPGNDSLAQYHVFCDEEGDKYLLIYTLIKLKLIQGKTLLFVNSITRSYRLKLFLEQFSISCCVLNSELPVNTRCHVVEQFNKGMYNYLIATDESSLVIAEPKNEKEDEKTKKGKFKYLFMTLNRCFIMNRLLHMPGYQRLLWAVWHHPKVGFTFPNGQNPEITFWRMSVQDSVTYFLDAQSFLTSDMGSVTFETASTPNVYETYVHQAQHYRKQRKAKMKEYGVSRGIDFQEVSNVINFDFPLSVRSYIHRAGRTARGENTGTALSFVVTEELQLLEDLQKALSRGFRATEKPLKPYRFKMSEIEGFRYRCKDAIRAVTKEAIKKARVKELRTEILNSTKLKTYFEENPNDLKVLRHDTVLRPMKVKGHMKNVPEYLIPPTLKGMYTGTQSAPKRPQQPPPSHDVKTPKRKKIGVPDPKYRKKLEDPLKSFKYVKEYQSFSK